MRTKWISLEKWPWVEGIVVFSFAWSLLLSEFAIANEAGFRESYAAYQVAAEAGDLHAALPHAQRAYELGLELYGPESRETGLLAFNFGAALNEIVEYDDANAVLKVSVDALTNGEGADPISLHDATLELGKSYLGSNDLSEAQSVFEELLDLDVRTFGASSLQAAETSYYAAMLPLFGDLGDTTGQYISMGRYVFELSGTQAAHLNRPSRSRFVNDPTPEVEEAAATIRAALRHAEFARDIFLSESDADIHLARLDLILASLTLVGEQPQSADGYFIESIDKLIELGYADHFSVHVTADWLKSLNRYEWTPDEFADHVNQVVTFANLRREGHPHALIRMAPQYPTSGIYNGIEATVCLSFTVAPSGRPEDIEVITADHPRMFVRSATEAMEQFVYAPQMENGRAVPRPNMRNCFDFTLGR